MKVNTHPGYVLSMTGIHGAGKGTLRNGLVAHRGFSADDLKVFALGRMLDAEGLWTCRENAKEQNRRAMAIALRGERAVTSRLGLLDVAIYGRVMQRWGKIADADVDSLLAAIRADLASDYVLPSALVALVCQPEALQERLLARDANAGKAASRGQKALARMVAALSEIYAGEVSIDPLVDEVLDHYRSQERFVLIDTSSVGIEVLRADVVAFLERSGLMSQPGDPRAG